MSADTRQIGIGELARRAGLSVRTVRFYSDAGVLPGAGRTEAGYRLYDAETVARAASSAPCANWMSTWRRSDGC